MERRADSTEPVVSKTCSNKMSKELAAGDSQELQAVSDQNLYPDWPNIKGASTDVGII